MITAATTKAELGTAFLSEGPRPVLSPLLSLAGLAKLANGNTKAAWSGELFELIASHPNADDSLLRTLVQLDPSEGTANAVVTSPRASPDLVREMLGSSFPSVREHARFGVFQCELRAELDRASEADFLELYRRHQDGGAGSLTARLLIVMHSSTPCSVLEALSADADAMIAERAAARLAGS